MAFLSFLIADAIQRDDVASCSTLAHIISIHFDLFQIDIISPTSLWS